MPYGDIAGIISLVFFCTFFAVVAVWVLRPKNKLTIESYKEIPFKEE